MKTMKRRTRWWIFWRNISHTRQGEMLSLSDHSSRSKQSPFPRVLSSWRASCTSGARITTSTSYTRTKATNTTCKSIRRDGRSRWKRSTRNSLQSCRWLISFSQLGKYRRMKYRMKSTRNWPSNASLSIFTMPWSFINSQKLSHTISGKSLVWRTIIHGSHLSRIHESP